MKPLIGITPSMGVDEKLYLVSPDNVSAITRAGGIPVILPYVMDESDIKQMAQTIDGLYTTGGYDVDPTYFGEEPHQKLGSVTPARDAFEIAMTKRMLELGKPILGVCRGCQILNVAVGGTMYQDIYSQIDKELLQHSQSAPTWHGSHFVTVLKGSLLHRLTGMETLKVNSRHHQANREVPEPFQVSGVANDGIIEAIESKEHSFVLGLQWHPESLVTVDDEASLRIYQGFIKACQRTSGDLNHENN